MLIAVILSGDFYDFRDPYARIIIKLRLIVIVMNMIIKQRSGNSVDYRFGRLLNTETRSYNYLLMPAPL